ncbi:protein of unknown function [Brochothrix thermosphacta]|nr:protein of unknown function [Brochothrix thermosphacta]
MLYVSPGLTGDSPVTLTELAATNNVSIKETSCPGFLAIGISNTKVATVIATK